MQVRCASGQSNLWMVLIRVHYAKTASAGWFWIKRQLMPNKQ